jgi:hypothetical protein
MLVFEILIEQAILVGPWCSDAWPLLDGGVSVLSWLTVSCIALIIIQIEFVRGKIRWQLFSHAISFFLSFYEVELVHRLGIRDLVQLLLGITLVQSLLVNSFLNYILCAHDVDLTKVIFV